MTIREFLNGVIYTGTVVGALTGIGVFIHFAIVRPMRAFLRKEIVGSLVDIKEAVEHNTKSTDDLSLKLDEHIANGGHAH